MSAVGIGQPQVIARAGAGGEVVGVSMGPGARQVTCTLVPQGVQVVDMASATCVLSWGLKGRAPLLPAAVVGSGERLVLACEDGTVLSWRAREGTDLADADVMKASKKKGTRLRMLLVDPTLEAVLLVSGDGQVRMMRPDLSDELCSIQLGLPKNCQVVFADLARAGRDSFLAVLVARSEDGSTSACRWRVNRESGSFTMSKARWDLLSGADGAKTAGDALTCALHRPPKDSAMQPTLSVLWESLLWQRFRVGTGGHPTLETSFPVSGVAPHSRRAASTSTSGSAAPAGGNTGVVATTIHNDYLLVVGGGVSGSGGGDTRTGCNSLTAWDCMYGTQQGHSSLQWSMDEAAMSHYASDAATSVRSSHDGSLVAVALEKCVVVSSVHSAAMSLEKVVAAAAASRSSAKATERAAMRPVDVLACITMTFDGDREGVGGATPKGLIASEAPRTRVAQAVQEGNQREQALIASVLKEGGHQWVESVKLYLEDLQAESLNTEAARREGTTQSAAKRRGRSGGGRAPVRVAVSEELVAAVMQRCMGKGADDGKFDEALLALVLAGAVNASAHPSLLPHAIESGNLVLLESILRHVPDLLEEHLLMCLKLILLNIHKHSMDALITHWAAAAPTLPVVDHDAVRRHLLDLVLLAPKDHWPLVKELKKLTLQEAERLLRYCQSLYKMHGVAANVQLLKPHKSSRTPHLRCVVEWITALLDAHFSALVLAPECHALLQDLKDITRAETALAKETLALDGLLLHVLQKRPLPVKPMRHYSVETLYLPM